LNAYFIHAGIWLDFFGQSSDLTCDVVFAPTRGKAKSLFYQKHYQYMDGYTDIKMCRLLVKNIDRKEGFAKEPEDDIYWEMVPGEWGNENI